MDKEHKGGQRLKPVKIKKARRLQLNLKKRCLGVFKKARELSTLCGVDVAVVFFSREGNKIYSFGRPRDKAVIERILSKSPPPNSLNDVLVARCTTVGELNKQVTKIKNQFELERRLEEECMQLMQAEEYQNLFTTPIEELNLQQLKQMHATMEKLSEKMAKKLDEFMKEANNPVTFPVASGSSGGGEAAP